MPAAIVPGAGLPKRRSKPPFAPVRGWRPATTASRPPRTSRSTAWNGRHYAAKRVRPVFVEEDNEIVVITVYTYFF